MFFTVFLLHVPSPHEAASHTLCFGASQAVKDQREEGFCKGFKGFTDKGQFTKLIKTSNNSPSPPNYKFKVLIHEKLCE